MIRFERRQDFAILFLMLVALVAIFLAGCVRLGPSADQLRALSESKRSWCLTQSNVYVPFLMIGGTGIEGGKMQCDRDGMRVDDKIKPAAPEPKPE